MMTRRLFTATALSLAALLTPFAAASASKSPAPKITAFIPVAAVPDNPVSTASYVYVASIRPSVLSVIDARTHHVATTLTIPSGSFASVISPALSTIYVASTNDVTVVSPLSNRVTASLHLPRVTALAILSNGDAAALYANGAGLAVINSAGSLISHRSLKIRASYLAASSAVYTLSFRSPKNPVLSSYSPALAPSAVTTVARGASGLVATPLGVFVLNVPAQRVEELSVALRAATTIKVKDPQFVTTSGQRVYIASSKVLYEYTSSQLVASSPLKAPLISMLFDGAYLLTTSFEPEAAFCTYNVASLKALSRLTLALATGDATLVPGSNLVYVSNHAGLVSDITIN